MNRNIISAVFDNHDEAERAVGELRSAGVSDRAISIVAQRDGERTATDGSGEEATKDIVGKTAAGAGVGALLGIAALAIPGVGPLVAAGAIAESAVGGAALTGTAVGAAAGGLSGILTDHGVSEEDARYYEERINRGGIFVSVDPDKADVAPDRLDDILHRHGGHSASRVRAATM